MFNDKWMILTKNRVTIYVIRSQLIQYPV